MTGLSRDAPVVVRRVIAASPERVFGAWVTPELVARWMSPIGHAEAELDVQVGGAFRVAMVGDGRRIEHTGTYREIDPPNRIVFTWRSPFTGGDSVVTVDLRAIGTGTEVVLRHERLPIAQADAHGSGWGSMLGRLAELVERLEET